MGRRLGRGRVADRLKTMLPRLSMASRRRTLRTINSSPQFLDTAESAEEFKRIMFLE
jgi:hypothetical protein